MAANGDGDEQGDYPELEELSDSLREANIQFATRLQTAIPNENETHMVVVPPFDDQVDLFLHNTLTIEAVSPL